MTVLVVVAFVSLAALGAVVRWLAAYLDTDLPIGTIGANTIASLLSGLVAASGHPASLLVGVALCGSLSTFSTLVRHLHDQAARNRPALMTTTVALSIGLGLLAATVGLEVGGT